MTHSDSKEDLLEDEVKRLNTLVKELNLEIKDLTQVIVENDLEEEIGVIKPISTEEQICIDGINHLSVLFKQGNFDRNDTQMLDILHKNLRMIRGLQTEPERKVKPKNVEELLKIVENK